MTTPSKQAASSADSANVNDEPARRGFLFQAVTVVVSAIVFLFAPAAGLLVVLDPLFKRGKAGEKKMYRVATLEAVPDDGLPRLFPIIADRKDAWTLDHDARIGAVYLRRLPGETTVEALSTVCPHAGCFVGYAAQR